ncbi:MAG: phosphatase PAP2 family protein, partial [Abitibacteriaceae bacterium]|nr:phosphatase PAP2 family protein [Abditibacteriaceae bacterium]
METVWQSGIRIIIFLQSVGHWPRPLMLFFSFLGTEYFYLLIMPALLWCVDARLGVRLGILFLLSASFNSILKLVFHAPRPFWLERKAGGFEFESSFGIPSGHAQNSMAVWGFLAAKQRVGKVWAAVIIFLIGLSRLYLGVHFPTDVLAGWVIGGALLWAFLRYE